MFDVTKRGSYESLEQLWIPEVKQHNTTPELVQIVVGNKIDVEVRSAPVQQAGAGAAGAVLGQQGAALGQQGASLGQQRAARPRAPPASPPCTAPAQRPRPRPPCACPRAGVRAAGVC